MTQAQELILLQKIKTLPPTQIAEVEHFIDFLHEREIVHSSMKQSEPSLQKIWDNPEDAVYDNL